ncbi:MAG: hypothetical protein ACK5JT_21580 [Hyphomicrobiaceae bacterium]
MSAEANHAAAPAAPDYNRRVNIVLLLGALWLALIVSLLVGFLRV